LNPDLLTLSVVAMALYITGLSALDPVGLGATSLLSFGRAAVL